MCSVATKMFLAAATAAEQYPPENSQLNGAHFGNFLTSRRYLFALTLAYS